MFFFNLVDHKVRFFTNKQESLALLHFRSFRQFQNLSEETWSCAAENLIELCFAAFLSNKSKKCFILVWITFSSSEIIAISSLHCVVWTFWQQTLKPKPNAFPVSISPSMTDRTRWISNQYDDNARSCRDRQMSLSGSWPIIIEGI